MVLLEGFNDEFDSEVAIAGMKSVHEGMSIRQRWNQFERTCMRDYVQVHPQPFVSKGTSIESITLSRCGRSGVLVISDVIQCRDILPDVDSVVFLWHRLCVEREVCRRTDVWHQGGEKNEKRRNNITKVFDFR